MNNSQSSDIFSDTNANFRDVSAIDVQTYEKLVSKIKTNAKIDFSAETSTLSIHFSSLLDDCSNCVFQGLDILVFLLEDSSTPIDKLCCYLEETICILQIISNSIKSIIESIDLTFSTMKTFSISTGNIILSVFSHCKDSESLYESHIREVEKLLKDLFRNCHELQSTYLTALEKYYIFNSTEIEQQDILIETLDINLKIGELVQALDVKTMAEQWKAFTVLCEKYSRFLLDKDTFNKTTRILVKIIHNHIKTFEVGEEDKVAIRSLKVASFSLKILLRICNIFKCGCSNNYEDIVALLQQILLCSSSHPEVTKISSKLINIANTHLLIPSDAIINQLVTEEKFVNCISSITINNLKNWQLLEYVLLLLSVMKASLAHKDMHEVNIKMINLVISVLPYCHTYLNMGLKFTNKNIGKNHGLFEHLLIHTLAVATSLDSQHYTHLERLLYEAILSTDYFCAAFSSNLWVLLCRSNSQLHLNTVISLIETYWKLETNALFLSSPQHIHLNFTIENLFKTLNYPEKLSIYKQFSVYQDKNDSLWCVLKIRNLPENLQMSANKVVSRKVISLLEICNKQFNEHLEDMISIMKLASTCEYLESDSKIESLLIRGWCKACPKSNKIKLQTNLDIHSLYYFRYLEALNSLTDSYYKHIENNSVFVKILHIISELLKLGNNEIIKLLFKIFCRLIVFQAEIILNGTVIETLKLLLEKDDMDSYIYSVISNKQFDNFFTQMLAKEKNLQEAFNILTNYKSKFIDNNEWQQRLQSVADSRYSHNCIQSTDLSEVEPAMYDSNFNPDFEFEIDNVHPVNKKAKLHTDMENILERLEHDVSQLIQVKENNIYEEHKIRIKHVCDKLKSILYN